jgi:hypothetical protein
MWRFYADPALTTQVAELIVPTQFDGVDQQPGVSVIYFGNRETGRRLLPADDSDIQIAVDGLAGARLALSEDALVSAVPGHPLVLGAELSSGSANAVQVWVLLPYPGELFLATNQLLELVQ